MASTYLEFKRQLDSKQPEYVRSSLQRLAELLASCKQQLLAHSSKTLHADLVISPGGDCSIIQEQDSMDEQSQLRETIREDFTTIIKLLSIRSTDSVLSMSGVNGFCREFGIDKSILSTLQSIQARQAYLHKTVHSYLRSSKIQHKLSVMEETYNVSAGFNPTTKASSPISANTVKSGTKGQGQHKTLDWLNIGCKYKNLEEKVKRMLVQSIIDTSSKTINGKQKLQISADDYDYEAKPTFQNWTEEDENNLRKKLDTLKHQFSDKNFLKQCQRFKHISQQSYNAIAYEELSRNKKGISNKRMSRDHILKKYLQSETPLTEKQIRFILNTSPLMNKSVNKTLISSTVKGLDQSVIDEIELHIADDIIQRFSETMERIKNTRKKFKNQKMDEIYEKIRDFEKELDARRKHESVRNKLMEDRKKFVLTSSSFNYMSKSTYKIRENESNTNSVEKRTAGVRNSHVPLNRYHPPSSVFTADNNNEFNEEPINRYEENYLRRKQISQGRTESPTRKEFLEFYSGGNNIKAKPLEKQKAVIKECLKAFCNTATVLQHKFSQDSLRSVQRSKQKNNETHRKNPGSMSGNRVDTKQSMQLQHNSANLNNKANKENALLKNIEENIEKNKKKLLVSKLLTTAQDNSWNPLLTQNYTFTPEEVNLTDKNGNSALYYAVKFKNLKFIEYLLKCQANVNQKCSKGETPLHLAFRGNSMPIIVECLAHNPDLNAVCDEGFTPIGRGAYKTLKVLGLLDGVATVTGNKKTFNNNKLLERPGNMLDQIQPVAL